jgi:hypothetical protein
VIGTTGFYIDVTDEFDEDMQRSLDEVVGTIAHRRAVINQAMGMLMLCFGVSDDEAFRMLAKRSQETNVKLRDLAATFVEKATAMPNINSADADRIAAILSNAQENAG